MALGTTIGGIRVDLQLNSAAFIRDIAKTNAAIAGSTRAMTTQLTRLQKVSEAVGATFGAWITVRTIKKTVAFLNDSIDLAAKLQNQLGETARAFQRQGEVMTNAFKLGVAQGFLNAIQEGTNASRVSLERLAQAGIILGNVLGRVFTAIVNFLTVEIPNGINQSVGQINSAITAYNALAQARDKAALAPSAMAPGAPGSALVGGGDTSGSAVISLLKPVDVGVIKSWIDLSSAEGLVGDAAKLAAEGQEKLGGAIKDTSKSIAEQTAAAAKLQQQHFDAAIKTSQQWLGVADTVGQALGVMFKENKAVAIAQAVINTAQAITEALKLPFPINWAQVAAVTALGAAQIATIASANPGSGSKATKKGTGGARAGGGGGGGSAPAAAGAASMGPASLQQAVTINVTGESFGPAHFRKLVEGLNGVIADGAMLRVNTR